MKRILAFILVMLVAALPACAEIDLSSMSFDDLLALQEKVVKEITSRAEWKEVAVPPGIYEVGVDIPVGKWTITSTDTVSLTWGSALDEYKADIPYSAEIADEALWNEGESVSWELIEGTFIMIKYNTVIFTPYVKQSLGF